MAGTPVRTVADLVAALQRLPQNLPVLAGCHYDNDDGFTTNVSVNVQTVSHSEDRFYGWADPTDPGAFQAVTVT